MFGVTGGPAIRPRSKRCCRRYVLQRRRTVSIATCPWWAHRALTQPYAASAAATDLADRRVRRQTGAPVELAVAVASSRVGPGDGGRQADRRPVPGCARSSFASSGCSSPKPRRCASAPAGRQRTSFSNSERPASRFRTSFLASPAVIAGTSGCGFFCSSSAPDVDRMALSVYPDRAPWQVAGRVPGAAYSAPASVPRHPHRAGWPDRRSVVAYLPTVKYCAAG